MMIFSATMIVSAFILIIAAGRADMTVHGKLSQVVVVSAFVWLVCAVFWLFAIVLHWGKV
jgi:hypothetical protein